MISDLAPVERRNAPHGVDDVLVKAGKELKTMLARNFVERDEIPVSANLMQACSLAGVRDRDAAGFAAGGVAPLEDNYPNSRSINSCAAVMPATPPPRTMTLEDIFQAFDGSVNCGALREQLALASGSASTSASALGLASALALALAWPRGFQGRDRPILFDPQPDLFVDAEQKLGVVGDLQKTDSQVGRDDEIDGRTAKRDDNAYILRQSRRPKEGTAAQERNDAVRGQNKRTVTDFWASENKVSPSTTANGPK